MENVTTRDGMGLQRQPKKYAQKAIVFKRFKTHHAKYIAADSDLASSTRFVLYVDVDNIIGKPLDKFFLDYSTMVANEYDQWVQHVIDNDTDDNPRSLEFGFFSMFRDTHLKGKMHSGIILHDLKFDKKCTSAWRKEMDEFYHGRDQTILLNVIGNYTQYQCKTFALPSDHFMFANKRLLEERKPQKLPTFIHITEFRVKRINDPALHQEFVRFVLQVKDDEVMADGIRWNQVLSPSVSRGNETLTP
jgi:hypothetical protein